MKRSIHQIAIQCTFDFDELERLERQRVASEEALDAISSPEIPAFLEKLCRFCKQVHPIATFRKVKYAPAMCATCAERYEQNIQKQIETAEGFGFCIECKEKKPHSEFYSDASYRCKKCFSVYQRERMKTDRGKMCARNAALRQKFNMTHEDYEAMLLEQGGGCAICGKQPSMDGRKKYLHVDHDHKTGVVRALLCHNCNATLGHAHDNPDILRKAALYIEKHSGTS